MKKMIDLKKWILPNVELILAFLVFLALFLALAIYAPGGPLSHDVAWYMNAGLNGIKDAFILNRYFHVFFEAIFLRVAPTPLIGVQFYWAFLITGTCLLIYLTARRFSHHSTPFHGILAVALFLSINTIADLAGIAVVDTTAMFMVMLLLLVYVTSNRVEHNSKWLIALFGFLLFLAFKTKETTVTIGILVIGFGFNGIHFVDRGVLQKRLAYLLLGIAGGIIFFVILNSFFLGDPLYGLRPGDFINFLRTYVQQTASVPKPSATDNWFNGYFLTVLWIPFVLYLIAGVKAAFNPDIDLGIRFLWLVPLLEILFVTVTVGNQWGYDPRFVYPVMPVVCLLGPQFLNLALKDSADHQKWVSAVLLFVFGLVFYGVFRVALPHFIGRTSYDAVGFITIVFVPVLFAFILALTFMWKTPSIVISSLITLLIVGIILIPLANNGKKMVRDHPNFNQTKLILYPFSAFSNQIRYSSDMHMYIDKNIWSGMGVVDFAKDRNSISSLFNIYFDASSVKSNFMISSGLSAIPNDILMNNYTDVLINSSDWSKITSDPETKSLLSNKYQVFYEKRNMFVLLQARFSGVKELSLVNQFI